MFVKEFVINLLLENQYRDFWVTWFSSTLSHKGYYTTRGVYLLSHAKLSHERHD